MATLKLVTIATSSQFYHLFGGQLYYRQSAEEKADAAALTDRLQAFYSTIPQSYPDAQWWNDVIDHYVRYEQNRILGCVVMLHVWILLISCTLQCTLVICMQIHRTRTIHTN